jgi:protein SCO1/2
MKYIICALAIAACSRASEPVRQPAPAPVIAPQLDEPSLYDLTITLRTSRGDQVGLDAARGRPVIVTMFYGSCSVACPTLIDDIKRTIAEIGRDDVRVLLVSFDAARDTPANLAALAQTRGLDDRWTLAAAADADARELAATLGFKFRKLDNGEFFHSATIVALDETGRPIARTEGFNQRGPLVAALR